MGKLIEFPSADQRAWDRLLDEEAAYDDLQAQLEEIMGCQTCPLTASEWDQQCEREAIQNVDHHLRRDREDPPLTYSEELRRARIRTEEFKREAIQYFMDHPDEDP